jgi:protein-S-isoprenylcysteine O-methyltransferase Ste14
VSIIPRVSPKHGDSQRLVACITQFIALILRFTAISAAGAVPSNPGCASLVAPLRFYARHPMYILLGK